jgi:uncharacterized protein with HEPN domain
MPLLRLEHLRHILDEAEYLIAQKQGLEKERFLKDATLKRAFVRSIEIIGEASKKVPTDLKGRHPGVNWKAIAGVSRYSHRRNTLPLP